VRRIAIEKWMQEKQGVQQDLLGSVTGEEAPRPTVSRTMSTPEGGMYQVCGVKEEQSIGACPDCGSPLEFAEGCVKCHVCGYSECG
jgi:ribonucleoside-diphosphate reductase alpha chain